MDHSGGGHYHSSRAKPFDAKQSKLQSTSLLASPVKAETEMSSYMVGTDRMNGLLGEIPKLAAPDSQSHGVQKRDATCKTSYV